MPKTGETCAASGIYKCSKHDTHQITMIKGHTFPPCDKAGSAAAHAAEWLIVKKTQH